MAKCYTLKNPNQNTSKAPKPKVEILHSILNFSKAYEIAKTENISIGFVLN